MQRGGTNHAVIDLELAQLLLMAGYTPARVAALFDVTSRTLYNHRVAGGAPLLRRPNGSGHTTAKGYLRTTVDGRPVRNHRLAMAEHLGRPLRDDEVVHHIDRDKKNNAIENLRVMSREEHEQLHGTNRLTLEQLADVRRLRAEGLGFKRIADAIGRKPYTVRDVIRRMERRGEVMPHAPQDRSAGA